MQLIILVNQKRFLNLKGPFWGLSFLFCLLLQSFSSFGSDTIPSNTLLIGYEPITTWLPSKKTLSYTRRFNEQWSLEAEYAWATIDFPIAHVDLGQIKEKRYSLGARRYMTKSFHFIFGANYNEFSARLGSDFLNDSLEKIEGGFQVKNIGITGGIGNRWHLDNSFTLGVDWFRLNIPIAQVNVDDQVLVKNMDEVDQKSVKKVIKAFNRVPTFVLLGVSIGYTF